MLEGNYIAGKGWKKKKKIMAEDVFTGFWSKMVKTSGKELPSGG